MKMEQSKIIDNFSKKEAQEKSHKNTANGAEEKHDAFESIDIGLKKIKLAKIEIHETAILEELEKKAGEFVEASQKLLPHPDLQTTEKYENDYAIPACQQVEKLHGIIEENNRSRAEDKESEKPFNAISSIMKSKKALCIHFLTGFSNENNKTTAFGLEVSNREGLSKRSREALFQYKVLAGLNPSVSASIFADSHNFEDSWCRNLGQPIGVIFREGECTEISPNDAASRSQSPKKRKGWGTSITKEQLGDALSDKEETYTQRSYNEVTVAEPRIGAIFIATKGAVSRECLKTLLKENKEYNYPILFENSGEFYELSSNEMINLLLEGDGEHVYVKKYLEESKEIMREEIRKRISSFENEDLIAKEKERFNEYVHNYELKPHFEWADELEAMINTKKSFLLNQEIGKISEYEANMKQILEKDGQLANRLKNHFEKNEQFEKKWIKKETYVDGELFKGSRREIPKGAHVEIKEYEFWEYEEDDVSPPSPIEHIVGIGEFSNFQKEIRRYLYVVKYPDGKIYCSASEAVRIFSNSIKKNGDVTRRSVYENYFSEAMETENGLVNIIKEKEQHARNYFFLLRPLHNVIIYEDENSIIIEPENLEQKISTAKHMDEKGLSIIAAHAFLMAEMCQNNGDLEKAEKWKKLALKFNGNSGRYDFIKSKLNKDGTLKLDNDDVSNL